VISDQYPQYADEIVSAAKASFLAGDQWAYAAGVIAVVVGAALVYFCFPRKVREAELVAGYHATDARPPHRRPEVPS
jgi:MFS transporter, DHA2 family, multidrug resistance protein